MGTFINTLWQGKNWETFQTQCGNEVFRIDTVLVIKRKTAFGKSFFEIPRLSPSVIDKNFYQQLEHLAKKEGALFARIIPNAESLEFPSSARKNGVPEIFPEQTLVIDLTQSEEEILADMKQKGRYNIKVAKKKGVEVYESESVEDFYSILEETGQRDDFSIHSKEVYNHMLSAFQENGFLLLAKFEDQIISGALCLQEGDVMTYYYGCSSNAHRNVMAPYLIQWTGIQIAKERGCEWYDFLGIAPENDSKHRLAGVSRFKEKFGGIRKTYAPAFEIVYSKGWDQFIRVGKAIKKLSPF